MALIVGVGLTVIVKLRVGPTHPFAVGEVVIVAVTGIVPELRAVNAAILPAPDAASPIVVRLLLQE